MLDSNFTHLRNLSCNSLRPCSVMIGPFHWVTVSAVKMTFSPFWNSHLYETTERSHYNQTGPYFNILSISPLCKYSTSICVIYTTKLVTHSLALPSHKYPFPNYPNTLSQYHSSPLLQQLLSHFNFLFLNTLFFVLYTLYLNITYLYYGISYSITLTSLS